MCFLDLLSFRVIKKFFPNFFSHLRDRVLKQLVKNLVFTFEFFSREKCAVLVSLRHSFVHFHFKGRMGTLSLSFISSATTHLSTGMAPCCFV